MASIVDDADYLAFELMVDNRTDDGYPVLLVESPAGELDTLVQVDLAQCTAFATQVAAGAADAAAQLAFGTRLFEEFFVEDLRDFYRSSLAIARQEGKRLRLRLRFRAPELHALPWEFIYDADEQHWLAATPEIAFVRSVPVRQPPRKTTLQLPLRLLIAAANPDATERLQIAREIHLLQDALQDLIDGGRVQIELLEGATDATLAHALRKAQPHVFHFVGHAMVGDDEGCLLLEDADGDVKPLFAGELRSLMASSADTRLIVLNACRTTGLLFGQGSASLAPNLMQGQVAAIIAMQHPIEDKASSIFTREFYRSIALGLPVEAAVTEARKGILLDLGEASHGWSAPVLYIAGREGTLFDIEQSSASTPTALPPPPQPILPPVAPFFVGREEELAYYGAKLAQTHFVAIVGMAGMGKSALASKLAHGHDDVERVFWHRFHEGEGVEALLWNLAAVLAWHGRAELWATLNAAKRAEGQLPPGEILFATALRLARGGNYVLCFDDFHHIADDPVLNHFVEELRNILLTGELSVILTARQMPQFVSMASFTPLGGLSYPDTRRLMIVRGLELDDGQMTQVHQATAGNAQLLILAIEALQHTLDVNTLIQHLSAAADVERYLLREVDEGLDGKERDLMEALAVCMGYPATLAAVEAIAGRGRLFRVVHELVQRHLLVAHGSLEQVEYAMHAIVQAFYYKQRSLDERRILHRRAAEYYGAQEQEPLRASLHFERAGDTSAAAATATVHLWPLLNQGHGRELRDLLARLQQQPLTADEAVDVGLALGQGLTLAGDSAAARGEFDRLLAALDGGPDSPAVRQQRARVNLGLGELTTEQDPRASADWLHRGLALAPENASELRARLWVALSHAELQLGNYVESEAAVNEALRIMPAHLASLRVQALVYLAGVKYAQGEFAEAQAVAERAVAQGERNGDVLHVLRALNNLANAKASAGDPEGAKADFLRALELAEQLGDLRVMAYLQLNLGLVWDILGDDAQALVHLQNGARLAEATGDRATLLSARLQLARLQATEGDWDEVERTVGGLAHEAEECGTRVDLSSIYVLQAGVALSRNELAAAHASAEAAIRHAGETDDMVQLAEGYCVLGQVLGRQQRYAETDTAFEKSFALVCEIDNFQTAETQMHWGDALLHQGRRDEGIVRLRDARTRFAKEREAKNVAQIDIWLESKGNWE